MRTIFLSGTLLLLTVGSALAQPPQLPTLPPPSPPPPPKAAVLSAHDLPEEPVPPPVSGVTEARPLDIWGPRFWANGDYMLMWYTPIRTVPLVQAVPSAMAIPGSTSSGGTTLFPENNRLEFHSLSGLQLHAGVNWEKTGLEVGGFVLERETPSAAFFNNGTPFAIARGYVSAGGGANTSLFTSLPGQYSGGVTVVGQSRLYGLEGAVRRGWYSFVADSTDLLIGFKYLDLSESLVIDSPASFPSGAVIDVRDSIRTRNNYYGGYVGFNSRWGGYERGLGLDLTSKSGVGGVGQRVELVGSNSIFPPGGPADVQAGGLYARGLNAGTFTRTKFAFVQDLNLKVTYNFNRWVQLSFGYSLTYLSSAVRPGRQIDAVINDSNVRFVAMPTPSNQPRPSFLWHAEEFTVQGVTTGLRVQY